jgi:hypothetical protein
VPGLVPGIHAVVSVPGAWMAGTSPAMTSDVSRIELPWAFGRGIGAKNLEQSEISFFGLQAVDFT